jgi:hypothetical protein
MRKSLFALLLAMACTSESDGTKGDDTDGDGVVDTDPALDDTDAEGNGIPQFDSVEQIAPFLETTFDGVDIVTYAPESPRGIVFVFHGTGGSATVATSTEMVAILNEMIEAGLGFVATSSINRGSGVFDDDSAPANNADFQFLSDLRDDYIAQGLMSESMPLYTMGFSAGGGFANYVGFAGADAGWNMRAMAFLGSNGGAGFYNGTAPLPTAWLPMEHDEKVSAEGVISRQEEHADEGYVSELMLCEETRLYPTRFARTRFISRTQSRDIWQVAVDNGFFDDRGRRLFGDEDIAASVDDLTNNYDVINPKPVRAQLNVVLATHAINGIHAERQAQFFVDHL